MYNNFKTKIVFPLRSERSFRFGKKKKSLTYRESISCLSILFTRSSSTRIEYPRAGKTDTLLSMTKGVNVCFDYRSQGCKENRRPSAIKHTRNSGEPIRVSNLYTRTIPILEYFSISKIYIYIQYLYRIILYRKAKQYISSHGYNRDNL